MHGLGKIVLIAGSNGCGKSHLLQRVEKLHDFIYIGKYSETRVSNQTTKSFYEALSDLSEDRQIITIKDYNPPTNIAGKMNYIHFTKNPEDGRYGFIPIN